MLGDRGLVLGKWELCLFPDTNFLSSHLSLSLFFILISHPDTHTPSRLFLSFLSLFMILSSLCPSLFLSFSSPAQHQKELKAELRGEEPEEYVLQG